MINNKGVIQKEYENLSKYDRKRMKLTAYTIF